MVYIFLHRDKNSSVYNEVAKILKRRKELWKCSSANSPIFHLMLGDRNNLPYNRLGLQPGLVQTVNYYRGSSELCRKVSSVRLLRAYRKQFGLEEYDWLPDSYIIVPRQSSPDSTAVEDDRELILKNFSAQTNIIWIAKVSSGAKGLGINLSRDVCELIDRIDSQKQSHVVQRYIERPLLLPGNRKFDIRVWVILDQSYRIYIYKEGVVRTCSDEYDVNDLSKLTGHLSNHCLQEELSPLYGHYEANNEIFFSTFSSLLREISGDQCSLEDHILPQIENIVKQCFEATQDRISTEGLPYSSFQLFGFDFLVDVNYKVWLLEVNGAPAASRIRLKQVIITPNTGEIIMTCSCLPIVTSATARDLLADMAEAIVQLCVDPIYPPDQSLSTHKHLFRLVQQESGK